MYLIFVGCWAEFNPSSHTILSQCHKVNCWLEPPANYRPLCVCVMGVIRLVAQFDLFDNTFRTRHNTHSLTADSHGHDCEWWDDDRPTDHWSGRRTRITITFDTRWVGGNGGGRLLSFSIKHVSPKSKAKRVISMLWVCLWAYSRCSIKWTLQDSMQPNGDKKKAVTFSLPRIVL